MTTSAAPADDPRVAILEHQLKTSKDVRVRAQTVLLLGQTGSAAGVRALCATLADREALVRTASAKALGDLRLPQALACLEARAGETDPVVRAELERAKGQGAVPAGSLYVSLSPVEDRAGLKEPLVRLAEAALRARLAKHRAALAPPNEDKKLAAAFIRARGLKAYWLHLQLLPGATERALRVELLVMTYPDQSLKGAWNVKAAGGKPESLINAMVPRVLDDAAADLEWSP